MLKNRSAINLDLYFPFLPPFLTLKITHLSIRDLYSCESLSGIGFQGKILYNQLKLAWIDIHTDLLIFVDSRGKPSKSLSLRGFQKH